MFARPKPSLDLRPLKKWRDTYSSKATTHFEHAACEAFEALPEAEQRHRYTEISAVRFALKVIFRMVRTRNRVKAPWRMSGSYDAGLQPDLG